VEVTDANGCSAAAGPVQLTQPERDDWTMGGNSGTDPVLHYLGTNDAADFVLKSNGQERLRLGGEGTIKLFGNAMDIGPVFRDEDGTLRIGDDRPDLINDVRTSGSIASGAQRAIRSTHCARRSHRCSARWGHAH
jgi:hypothetical protein